MRLVPFLAFVFGCVSVRTPEQLQLDGAGLVAVSVVVDRGDLTYVAATGTDVDLTATVWGNGSSRDKANARQDTVDWSAVVEQGVLLIDGFSPEPSSGVDFDVVGPIFVSMDVALANGDLEIRGAEGVHVLTASAVTGDAWGDLTVIADTVDLNFVPYEATDALIESGGAVTLGLPFGLAYDLTIRTGTDQSVTVAELGFQDVSLGPGFFNGYSGFGDVEIDINATGPVEIIEIR
jgi:hypothetical protein